MRVGIFGGSFNPIHQQHLRIARAARDSKRLDEVWFVPVFQPVHKDPDDLLDYAARRKLLKLALKNDAVLKVCDAEKELGGASYTIRTIKHLQKKFPQHEFLLIIGGDSLNDLPTWRCIDELVKLVEFIVVERPGCEKSCSVINARINWLPAEVSEVSSSGIREEIRSDKDLSKKLERPVFYEIVRSGLYLSKKSAYLQFLPCIEDRLKKLPNGLQQHIDNVARLAFNYAIDLGQSRRKAVLAGLGHDLFRVSSPQEIFSLGKTSGYSLAAIEKQVPMLAHGAAAAGFFARFYELSDAELLEALRFHTLPEPGIGLLAQILVVSDCLEPGRKIDFRDRLRTSDMPWKNLYQEVVGIKEAARPK